MAITKSVARNSAHPYNTKLMSGYDILTISAGGEDELTNYVRQCALLDWHVWDFGKLEATLYKPVGQKGSWTEPLENRPPGKSMASGMPGPDMSYIDLKPKTDDRTVSVQCVWVVALSVPGTDGWSKVAAMHDHGGVNGKSFPSELYGNANFYTEEDARKAADKFIEYRAEEQKVRETKTKKNK